MMYHLVQADGSRVGPYDLTQLQQLQNQGRVMPYTLLVESVTGDQLEAHQVPGLFQSMAWRDPIAQKLPPGRLVRAVVLYPVWLLLNLVFGRYSSTIGEDDLYVLEHYCGVWGKVYMGFLVVLVAGVYLFLQFKPSRA